MGCINPVGVLSRSLGLRTRNPRDAPAPVFLLRRGWICVTVLMQPHRGKAAGQTHSQGCAYATLGFLIGRVLLVGPPVELVGPLEKFLQEQGR